MSIARAWACVCVCVCMHKTSKIYRFKYMDMNIFKCSISHICNMHSALFSSFEVLPWNKGCRSFVEQMNVPLEGIHSDGLTMTTQVLPWKILISVWWSSPIQTHTTQFFPPLSILWHLKILNVIFSFLQVTSLYFTTFLCQRHRPFNSEGLQLISL